MRLIRFAALGLFLIACVSLADSPTLSLKLTALEPNIKAGGNVIVRVTATNESNQTITYHNTSPFCNYSFKVLTGAGAPAPETNLKKHLICNGPLHITGRDIVITLKPGESDSEDLRLTELYDLSQPGEYSVQVTRIFPEIGAVTSNVASVNVIP